MRSTRAAGAVGAVGALALVLSGCAASAPESGSAGEGLEIVVTTTQLADVTRELVGDGATVTSLLQPGASAHSFDPGPSALSALASADLLVVSGAGLEGWLDDTVEASGFAGTLVDTSEGLDLLAADGDPHAGHDHAHEGEEHDHAHEGDDHAHEGEEHDHAHEGDDHAHEGDEHAHAHEGEEHEHEHAHEGEEHAHAHEDDDHAHEGEQHDHAGDEHAHAGDDHDHDHGEFDPHVWTDPANVIVQAEAIRDAVTEADPDLDIDASATAYLERLEALEAWMRDSIEQVPVEERLVVTTHDTFGYLERAFDVQVVGTVLPSIDDSADASAAHIDELVAEIRDSGAPVVFSENAIDPQLAATIAREAGVELREGEDALAADALGAEGSETGTYIGSQIHNTTAIVMAWGAEPLAVPESLS